MLILTVKNTIKKHVELILEAVALFDQVFSVQ